jgi:D-serine deaminase-like pyridoxal phosphate-dependent protein
MLIRDLPTPALLIEQSRLESNLARMQARASDNDVRLRPHVKTHKSIDLARMQRESGASGITVAKPSEAECFVNGGLNDIRIAYPSVARHHLERIAGLMDRATVSFCIDTMEGARAASDFFESRGLTANILIEVDCGYGRCGIPWDSPDSIGFGVEVSRLRGLKIIGILTHAGHSYSGPAVAAESPSAYVQRIAIEERDRMLALAKRLYESGIRLPSRDKFEISIGSTPTMSAFTNASIDGFSITEIRPGNYVFNDAIQVALGVARPQECALTVMATVVSKHRDRRSHERIFLDTGRKILTSDSGFRTEGYGLIVHSPTTMAPLPHAVINKLSEEHGWMEVRGGSTLSVRDTVRIIPNHACVVMNTQNVAYLVSNEKVLREIRIDARGLGT